MRISAPIARQLHTAAAKLEAALRDAIGEGNHRKTGRLQRLIAGIRPGGPEYGNALPVKFPNGPAAQRIQRQARCALLQHQVSLINFHLAQDFATWCRGIAPWRRRIVLVLVLVTAVSGLDEGLIVGIDRYHGASACVPGT